MNLKVAASHMVEGHGCDEYLRMRIRLVTESSRTQGWRELTRAVEDAGSGDVIAGTCGCEGESPVVEVGGSGLKDLREKNFTRGT